MCLVVPNWVHIGVHILVLNQKNWHLSHLTEVSSTMFPGFHLKADFALPNFENNIRIAFSTDQVLVLLHQVLPLFHPNTEHSLENGLQNISRPKNREGRNET